MGIGSFLLLLLAFLLLLLFLLELELALLRDFLEVHFDFFADQILKGHSFDVLVHFEALEEFSCT